MNDKITSKKIIRTSLVLGLIILAFIVIPSTSYFSVIKPAMAAGTLPRVDVIPMTSIVNSYTTYDIIFKTATTGTIKTIEIVFTPGSGINPSNTTILIERVGIGAGTISGSNVSGVPKLTYTVTTPVSVAAGTTVRLEAPKIFANQPGNWFATIATKGATGNVIDGPTQSPRFPIR
jgi:hypothetical protein